MFNLYDKVIKEMEKTFHIMYHKLVQNEDRFSKFFIEIFSFIGGRRKRAGESDGQPVR